MGTHDVVHDTFVVITWNVDFPCGTRTITHIFFNHIPLFLSMNWHCAHQRWNSHPNWCCHCWSNISGFTLPILHTRGFVASKAIQAKERNYCHNPSLGLTTKAKGLQGCKLKGSSGVTLHAPGSARECEGMNLHIPKGVQLWELESWWTPKFS
jgi:hypothetical protein